MRISRLVAVDRSTPFGLANFDSTTVFVRAAASYLRGQAFPALGMLDRRLVPIAKRLNRLPRTARQTLYTVGGANEGISPERLGDIDVERFRRWAVDRYPTRGYPAVIVGSSNGAAVHLAALLGVPWLPQTFLVPVRRSMDADAIRADAEWGADRAGPFLAANPDVSVRQMHDPNQDRLMVRKLAYFRVKSRSLGDAYEAFLRRVLEPGGTIVSLECGYEWPAIDFGERHSFQLGGLGGLSPEEYYVGCPAIADFLDRRGVDGGREGIVADGYGGWDAPEPDVMVPEAEWGFDPALRDDLDRVASERGYDRRRLRFDDPRDLSPFVADLYRDRYARRDRPVDRLLVQSFALVEPWWTIRTGSVPYWSAFNTRPDADALESYLAAREPYDEVWSTLFSHGVRSAGLASIDRWRTVLANARTRHGFVGVDAAAYPCDIETLVRYHDDLPDAIAPRHPHPPPMAFERFDSIASEVDDEYAIEWERD